MAAEPDTLPSNLTIGAVCRMLGEEFDDISISKIRFLEDQKLIAPRRTQGGYRLFSLDDVERLRKTIGMAQDRFGPLKGIFYNDQLGSDSDNNLRTIKADECGWYLLRTANALTALESVVEETEPDFCLLLSSLTTVVPLPQRMRRLASGYGASRPARSGRRRARPAAFPRPRERAPSVLTPSRPAP